MRETDCIFFQIAKIYQLSSRFLTQRVSELDLTAVQAMILGFLHEEDRITSVELGSRAGLDSATLTGILDRLEAAGLIERKGNPEDRRSIHIHLTQKGKEVAKQAASTIEAANFAFLKGLTEEQRRDLYSIIHKLRLSAPRA